MTHFFYLIRIHLLELVLIILNLFYFIPKTIEWLSWQSGVTMGYIGIGLLFNYLIHIFFITSCYKLVEAFNKNYRLLLLIVLMLLSILSFIFAFRIVEFIVFVPVSIYIFIFYKLFKKIDNQENSR